MHDPVAVGTEQAKIGNVCFVAGPQRMHRLCVMAFIERGPTSTISDFEVEPACLTEHAPVSLSKGFFLSLN
jgi:hypothetical protein